MQRLLPALALCLLLAVAGAEDLPAFNLRVKPLTGWIVKVTAPNCLELMTLGGSGSINVEEAEMTAEAVRQVLVERLQQALNGASEPTLSEWLMPLGRLARLAVFDYKDGTRPTTAAVAAWTDQGLIFNCVIDIRRTPHDKAAQRLQAILAQIERLGDRPAWTARLAATPTPIALAGGLATLTLPQPRWTEISLDDHRDLRNGLDNARFQWVSGSAWITLEINRSTHDQALAAIEEGVRNVVPGAPIERVEREGLVWFSANGSDDVVTFARGTAVAADGCAVEIFSHGDLDQAAEIRADVDALAASVRIRANADDLAFIAVERTKRVDLTPALADLLGDGRPAPDRDRGHASPDRRWTLVDGKTEWCIEAADGTRTPLGKEVPRPSDTPTWNRDSSRIAWVARRRLVVATLAPWAAAVHDIPDEVSNLTFAGEDLIGVCRNITSAWIAGRWLSSTRLVRIGADGALTTLCTYPLASFAGPAVSPDGRWLAVRCNRDATDDSESLFLAPLGQGAIAAADLRPVGRDGAVVGWTPDNRLIWAADRCLWETDPQTGATSLLIGRFDHGAASISWSVAGTDLHAQVTGWRLRQDRRGTWTVPLTKVRDRPFGAMPPPHDAHAWCRAEEDLRAVLGTDPGRVVPEAALLARLADALVGVAARRFGHTLTVDGAGLENLASFVRLLHLGDGEASARLLAVGAFYGECLRRSQQAVWRIAPLPFGVWRPGTTGNGDVSQNALAEVELPFSAVLLEATSFDASHLRLPDLETSDGRRLLLVYPPSRVRAELDEAAGSAYVGAWQQVRTNPAAALAALEKLVQEHPGVQPLLEEALILAEATGMPVDPLIDRAIAAGCSIPKVLLRRAEAVAATDAARALALLQTAARSHKWVPADVYARLGDHYERQQRPDLARSCWRAALRDLDNRNMYNDEDESQYAERFTRTEPKAPATASKPGGTVAPPDPEAKPPLEPLRVPPTETDIGLP